MGRVNLWEECPWFYQGSHTHRGLRLAQATRRLDVSSCIENESEEATSEEEETGCPSKRMTMKSVPRTLTSHP